MDPLTSRIRTGLTNGLYIAVGCTMIAVPIYAIVGSDTWQAEAPAPLWAFIALYFGGGLIGGVIYEVLSPMQRFPLGYIIHISTVDSLVLLLIVITVHN